MPNNYSAAEDTSPLKKFDWGTASRQLSATLQERQLNKTAGRGGNAAESFTSLSAQIMAGDDEINSTEDADIISSDNPGYPLQNERTNLLLEQTHI
uniref:Uncharacterized protein n=1 Tax=Strigamia maritima TaxID=126957 RepID=T1IIQ3_STRMM